jgi:hypothetical protein
MEKFDVITYKIPVFTVCFLEYGDNSDLTETEITQINEFLAELPPGHFSWPNIDENKYFSNSNDISSDFLACDVVEVDFICM